MNHQFEVFRRYSCLISRPNKVQQALDSAARRENQGTCQLMARQIPTPCTPIRVPPSTNADRRKTKLTNKSASIISGPIVHGWSIMVVDIDPWLIPSVNVHHPWLLVTKKTKIFCTGLHRGCSSPLPTVPLYHCQFHHQLPLPLRHI